MKRQYGSCSRFILMGVCLIAVSGYSAANEKISALDGVLGFFQQNVVDRRLVSSQWEPKQKDQASGAFVQRTFTRTSWYTNARKTDFGMTVDYRVEIRWKTFRLDAQGKPTGAPFDLASYDTRFEIVLAAYPGLNTLQGIYRAVEGSKDGKPQAFGPSDVHTIRVYLTQEGRREVLHLDVGYLFPLITKVGSEENKLAGGEWFEELRLNGSKLQRSQLWIDRFVDPQTLQLGRPLTNEKELYQETE